MPIRSRLDRLAKAFGTAPQIRAAVVEEASGRVLKMLRLGASSRRRTGCCPAVDAGHCKLALVLGTLRLACVTPPSGLKVKC
jgi:hypothetical protein